MKKEETKREVNDLDGRWRPGESTSKREWATVSINADRTTNKMTDREPIYV